LGLAEQLDVSFVHVDVVVGAAGGSGLVRSGGSMCRSTNALRPSDSRHLLGAGPGVQQLFQGSRKNLAWGRICAWPTTGINMRRMSKIIGQLYTDETGGEVLEYALITGLIIVGCLAMIAKVGTKVLARWGSLNSSL
jgi:Flp pilus assembly pilin Flp